jgi:hypothetical protein
MRPLEEIRSASGLSSDETIVGATETEALRATLSSYLSNLWRGPEVVRELIVGMVWRSRPARRRIPQLARSRRDVNGLSEIGQSVAFAKAKFAPVKPIGAPPNASDIARSRSSTST